VGDEGVAVVAASNRDAVPADAPAFDYYELFDLVAGEFEDVRMVAQLPFHGVALAELGRDDEPPSVSVDTQLAPAGRAPDAFVAVASAGGVALEPYCIVELPAAGPGEVEEAEGYEEEEDEASVRLLDEVRARMVEVERSSAAALAAHVEQLRERAARIAELERSLEHRAAQLAEASVEVEEMRSAAEAGQVAAVQVEELARRADRAERALAAMGPELSRVTEAQAAEHARFEDALRERAHAIRALEGEVMRRERMVRELVDRLEESESPSPADGSAATEPAVPAPADDVVVRENAALREKLDSLALELARREGEAQAAAWAVAELERRVAQAERTVAERALSPAATPVSGTADAQAVQGRLAAALDELDVLRQAVAQEHSMRIRAESGEELARAKAEIQRQANLLEELGHPAGGSPAGADLHSSGK
jgi:DNA repair exonuclease SbcCD ATPase subunit